jgi:hypothetical protein
MEPCACFRILGSGGLSGFQEIKSLRLAFEAIIKLNDYAI